MPYLPWKAPPNPEGKFQRMRNNLDDTLDNGKVDAAEQYKRYFGKEAFKEIRDMILDHHLNDAIKRGGKECDLIKSASELLALELRNASAAAHRAMVLVSSMRNPRPVENHILDGKSYTEQDREQDLISAAKWIVKCSNSMKTNSDNNVNVIKSTLDQRSEGFVITIEYLKNQ